MSLLAGVTMFVLLIRAKGVPGFQLLLLGGVSLLVVAVLTTWMDYRQVSVQVVSLWEAATRALAGEARPQVWRNTLRMFLDYPFFGVGLAGFAVGYPFYQSQSLAVFFEHAENDYVQLLAEAGVAGALVAFAGVALFAVLVWRRFADLRDVRMISLAVGGIASVVTFAVHSTVDFNLHIPANALHFSLLLGLLVVIVHSRGGETNPRFTLPFLRVSLEGRKRLAGGVLALGISASLAGSFVATKEAKDKIYFEGGMSSYVRMLVAGRQNLKETISQGKQSVDLFRRAIFLNPANYVYHYHLGWTLGTFRLLAPTRAGDLGTEFTGYLSSFQTALRLSPVNPRLHYAVAMLFMRNWDFLSRPEREFGRAAFEKAVTLLPVLRIQALQELQGIRGRKLAPGLVLLLEGAGGKPEAKP